MNFKVAIVLLFAFVATSQAAYGIITSYSDSSCTPANVISQFYTNDPSICSPRARRSIMQIGCDNETLPGVNFNYDFSYCENDTIPSVPSTWQVIQLNTESTCNATADQSVTSFLAAPEVLSHTLIAFATSQTGGLTAANTSMACNTAGNLTVSTCVDVKGFGNTCFNFNLQNNVCTLDTTVNAYFGLQTTCTAAPVSPPVAAPESSSGPVATTSPVNTPVQTPAKPNSASIVYGSVALLSVVALL